MYIKEYFGDWSKVIDFKELETIIKYLQRHSKIVCPRIKNLFRAFTLCSLKDTRVIIIGQDPYATLTEGVPVATGIAFGNQKDTPENKISPSLEVLMKSIIDFTYPKGNINFDLSLEEWEKQGVILLNSSLSCEIGNPRAHTLLWRSFMITLLKNLSNYTTGIVYVLMGKEAQSYESYIDSEYNYIIKTLHPAWYARNKEQMPEDWWKQINQILNNQNGYGIKWYNKIN